jgi:hypothetical protein
MKLRRQRKEDMRGKRNKIRSKEWIMSSLEKPEYLVYQTRQSSFHTENLCSNYLPKMI